MTITARKATAQKRRHFAEKRGKGEVRGESIFVRLDTDDRPGAGIGDVLGSEPTPELANMVADNCRHLLNALGDDSLRHIAVMTLEGYTTSEIPTRLGCVRRTVERKLERIRDRWSLVEGAASSSTDQSSDT